MSSLYEDNSDDRMLTLYVYLLNPVDVSDAYLVRCVTFPKLAARTCTTTTKHEIKVLSRFCFSCTKSES